jgi:S-adenosyl-L-methionine hydrolase (adenosine-forming)
MESPIITLLTDFGLQDGYVASLKGSLLTVCPAARLIDITHLVPAHDIRAGAYLLKSTYRDFPAGTIHLAVVDPGVGSERLGIALKTPDHCFVGPDNGIFSWVLHDEPAWNAFSLTEKAYWRTAVSNTFHGRDIFAPVAAHLALGIPLQALGQPCAPLARPWTEPRQENEALWGEVIHIDHFGNVITNVTFTVLKAFAGSSGFTVAAGEILVAGMRLTYSNQAAGEPLTLIGSTGHLEIAANQGNAASLYGIRTGDVLRIQRS